MMDLTLVVADIVLSIVLLILGIVLVRNVSRGAGYKLIFFRLEKVTKKEIQEKIKDQIEILKAKEKINQIVKEAIA